MIRVSEMAIKLIKAKEETNQHEDVEEPFNVWKGNLPPRRTLHEIVESAEETSMESEIETASMGTSQFSYGEHHLTRDEVLAMGNPPICKHSQPCLLWTVKKQGPNLGRTFWRCPMPRAQQCRCFLWTAYQPIWTEEKAKLYNPPPGVTNSAASTTPTESSWSVLTKTPCPHARTTKAGSNAYVDRVKCRDCGKLLSESVKSTPIVGKASSPSPVNPPNDRPGSTTNAKPRGQKGGSQVDELTAENLREYEEFKQYQEFRRLQKAREGRPSSSRP